jgi:iron complex outermembrane receptor protein
MHLTSRCTSRLAPLGVLAASLTLFFGSLSAQVVTPPTDDTPPPPPKESLDKDVLHLNPFVVSTSGDIGYLAQNSLSGSRLNSNLADLAVPTTAFTQELLRDIGVLNIDDLAEYMVSTKVDYPEGDNLFLADDTRRFRIRGLPAFNYSVNFFETTLRLDTYNTERVEQSRGPNSILFGLGSPGGVVNVATKKAIQNRQFGSVGFQVNSINGFRADIDFNQPLIKDKLAIRIAAVSDHEDSWRTREYDNQDRLYGTLGWQIGPKTRLDAEIEGGHVEKSLLQPMVASDAYTTWLKAGKNISTTPNAALGIRRLTTTNYEYIDTTTGQAWNWINKSASTTVLSGGVQTWLTDFDIIPRDVVVNAGVFPQLTDYRRASFFLTHSFTKDLNFELAGNSQYMDHDAVTGRSGGLLNADTEPTLPNGQPNPNAGRAYVEFFPGTTDTYDKAENLRASLAYTKDFGPWFGQHQAAVMYQQDWTNRQSGQRKPIIVTNPYNTADPQNGQNVIRFRSYFNLDGPKEDIGAGDWQRFFTNGDWREGVIPSVVDAATGRQMSVGWVWNAVPQNNYFERKSAMALLQSHWLKDRLVTVVGYRRDNQNSKYSISDAALARGPAVAPFALGDYQAKSTGVWVDNEAKNLTYSGVLRVTKNFSLTYNHSKNAALPDPNAFVVTDDGTGRPPSPVGISDDIGIKYNLGKRFSLVALYYETSADKDTANSSVEIENKFPTIFAALDAAKVAAPDGGRAIDVPNKFNRYTFNSAAHGYEVELVANFTDSWRAFVNYSDGVVEQTNIGVEARDFVAQYRDYWLQGTNGRVLIDGSGGLAAVADDGDSTVETIAEQVKSIDQNIQNLYITPDGQQARGQVRRSVNLVTNYTFRSGALKGFTFGGGVQYRSGEVVDFTITTDSSGNVTKGPVHGEELKLLNLNAAYRNQFKWFARNIKWSVQLNVTNVLDEDKILPTRVVAGATTTYRLVPPQQWALSSRFDF